MAKNLHTELTDLIARHLPSKGEEAQDILMDLALLLNDAEVAPVYQYRHQMGWDDTWMDLDESQLEHVLRHGHTVERRPIAGGWEPVTEVPA
jgi:hypothetical protein